MRSREIQQTWSTTLASALQDHYGLSEVEARAKVDTWLESMSQGTLLYTPKPAPVVAGLGNRRRRLWRRGDILAVGDQHYGWVVRAVMRRRYRHSRR